MGIERKLHVGEPSVIISKDTKGKIALVWIPNEDLKDLQINESPQNGHTPKLLYPIRYSDFPDIGLWAIEMPESATQLTLVTEDGKEDVFANNAVKWDEPFEDLVKYKRFAPNK